MIVTKILVNYLIDISDCTWLDKYINYKFIQLIKCRLLKEKNLTKLEIN